MALAAADRRLLLLAGLAFLLLAGSVAFLTPSQGQGEEGDASTYSSAPGGARAAFVLLQQLGLPVERWENSPVDLPADSSRAVLVLAEPGSAPSKQEQASLRRFVESGGTILFTGAGLDLFFPEVHPSAVPYYAQFVSYPALLPSAYTRGASTAVFRPRAVWGKIEGAQLPLYGDDSQHPVAVSWRIGLGHLLWWAGPTPLTNAGISRADNLNLFLNSVGAADSSAGTPQKIYWDEYFHGERSSLWAYFANTPVAWGLLQLAILGLAVFFTFGRRSGPVVPARPTPRLWPLEFVDTLGALYEHAGAASAAVAAVYKNSRAALTGRLRLPPAISDAALALAVEKRLGWHGPDLAHTFTRASAAARGEKIAPAEALELVQELEYCRRQVEFNRLQANPNPRRP